MKIYEIDEGFKDSFKKLNKGIKGFKDSFKTGFNKSSEVGAVVDPFKKGWKDAEGKNKNKAKSTTKSKTVAKPAPQVKFSANQPVQFMSKAGKLTNAKVVGASKDGDDSVVIINTGKQNFIIKRAKLLDPKTGKPF